MLGKEVEVVAQHIVDSVAALVAEVVPWQMIVEGTLVALALAHC